MSVVGSKVRDADGFRGTVRYIGPVAAAKNQEEDWLGIEWDVQSRGKHDGSCVDKLGKLHRYFTCGDTSGSFVKPGKIEQGRTFMERLRDRYVEEDAPLLAPDNIVPGAFVNTSKGNLKSIEFLGEQRIRKWQQIATVNTIVMRSDLISSAGEGLEAHVGHMTSVDLQDNLLWQWVEVANLVRQMPLLERLLLHGNDMQELTSAVCATLPQSCFSSIRVLALNACGISSWSQVTRLEGMLPCVEELYLSRNNLADMVSVGASDSGSGSVVVVGEGVGDIKSVFSAAEQAGSQAGSSGAGTNRVTGFAQLKVLDISGCCISSWTQVLALGALPQLQDLLLDENPLTSVADAITGSFAALQRVSISSTKLSAWTDIDALVSYPRLSCLRLSHVPLFAGKGASEVRPVVIARMERLQFFNGSMVTSRERIDSEKSYIRRVLRERTDIENGVVDVIAIPHPRFETLHARYSGEMLDFGAKAQGPTIGADLINITFKNLAFSSATDARTIEPVSKKVPMSLTLSRLKLMVKQLFKLDPPQQQLSIMLYKDSPPQFMDDDEAALGYYGATDGSVIFVNETDNV